MGQPSRGRSEFGSKPPLPLQGALPIALGSRSASDSHANRNPRVTLQHWRGMWHEKGLNAAPVLEFGWPLRAYFVFSAFQRMAE